MKFDMKFDITQHFGAVTRVLTERERDGKPARVILATRTYDTTIDDLWDALTNAERLPRWFLPVTGELRLGGRFQFQGNAGGEVQRCEPPRHVAITWEFGGQVSWVEVRLAEEARGGTRLELEHIAHVPPEFWDQYGPGAVGIGWELALMGLAEHLATRAALDPAAVQAWNATADGRELIRQISEAWGQASIAAGTDPAAATAAATRTTAFYTPAPDTPPSQ